MDAVRWSAFSIWPTDRRFHESPPTGLPECVCSRCGEPIGEDECPLRCWPVDGRFEYRYHLRCVGGEAGP